MLGVKGQTEAGVIDFPVSRGFLCEYTPLASLLRMPVLLSWVLILKTPVHLISIKSLPTNAVLGLAPHRSTEGQLSPNTEIKVGVLGKLFQAQTELTLHSGEMPGQPFEAVSLGKISCGEVQMRANGARGPGSLRCPQCVYQAVLGSLSASSSWTTVCPYS